MRGGRASTQTGRMGAPPWLMVTEACEAFEAIDTDGDGNITRVDFMLALNADPRLAARLQVVGLQQQEEESRRLFDVQTQNDFIELQSINRSEFLSFYISPESSQHGDTRASSSQATASISYTVVQNSARGYGESLRGSPPQSAVNFWAEELISQVNHTNQYHDTGGWADSSVSANSKCAEVAEFRPASPTTVHDDKVDAASFAGTSVAPVHLSQGRSVVSAAPHPEDYVLTDKIIDSYLADSQPISEQNTHVLQLPYGPPSDSRTQSDACTRSNAQSSPSSHWSSTARPPSSWVEVSRQVQEERERQQEWALLREQNEQMLHQRQQQNYQDTARMEKEETELPLKQLPSALYTSAKRLRAATLLLQRRQDKNAQDQLHATDSLRAPSEVTNTTTQNEKRVLGGPPRDPRNMLGQLTPVADKINKMLEDVKTSRKRSTDLKKHPGVLPLETNYVEDPLQNASLEDPLQNASLPRTRAVVPPSIVAPDSSLKGPGASTPATSTRDNPPTTTLAKPRVPQEAQNGHHDTPQHENEDEGLRPHQDEGCTPEAPETEQHGGATPINGAVAEKTRYCVAHSVATPVAHSVSSQVDRVGKIGVLLHLDVDRREMLATQVQQEAVRAVVNQDIQKALQIHPGLIQLGQIVAAPWDERTVLCGFTIRDDLCQKIIADAHDTHDPRTHDPRIHDPRTHDPRTGAPLRPQRTKESMAEELIHQSSEPTSRLRMGVITRHILSISAETIQEEEAPANRSQASLTESESVQGNSIARTRSDGESTVGVGWGKSWSAVGSVERDEESSEARVELGGKSILGEGGGELIEIGDGDESLVAEADMQENLHSILLKSQLARKENATNQRFSVTVLHAELPAGFLGKSVEALVAGDCRLTLCAGEEEFELDARHGATPLWNIDLNFTSPGPFYKGLQVKMVQHFITEQQLSVSGRNSQKAASHETYDMK